MRRPDDIALELLPQDPCVTLLHAGGHCLPDVWESLMPVQAAQLEVFSVEIKTFLRKLRFAKTDSRLIMIDRLRAVSQIDTNFVEPWLVNVPEINTFKIPEKKLNVGADL